MSNPRSNVVRRWEFGSVCPDGYEGPGGELNVKQRRFQAPAGFNLMFTPSQWYQDAGKHNHFSFHEELREKLASFFDRNNKVESSFEILSTHDHVLGDGSPFVQLNGPAKEIDPILGHIRRFSFTEEVFLRDGGKCERHGDEEESFLFRPRTKEENRALAEYGSTPIAWDWGEKSTYDNYTKSFEVLQPDGSWNVKEDRILYRALPTCVFKSDLCPNFFYDKRAQALKKKIIIREITAGKRPGRYSVKRRYMKSLLFDLTKRFAITSNTETKARSGFLEGTVLRVQCKKWQEKAPMSIRCTRIGEDPHLRFIICKNNVCNEDFNEKELRFFEIDNLNRCSQYSS
ncbi:unnamed protein product [Oikopleura dioica]|uniref:Uncharacterized protein n=1 Tax=Oikopleura dioica TaxID=34765 RepID=E4XKU3_OIKDI|nr:unnamed protein product [Oikopleura dioica]